MSADVRLQDLAALTHREGHIDAECIHDRQKLVGSDAVPVQAQVEVLRRPAHLTGKPRLGGLSFHQSRVHKFSRCHFFTSVSRISVLAMIHRNRCKINIFFAGIIVSVHIVEITPPKSSE